MSIQEKHLKRLESLFKVNYPTTESATYKSLVNYSMDLESPIQRWFRYKEGYSEKLVDTILDEHRVASGSLILDPFLGSGTTIVAAQKRGCNTVGYEVNPFSYFLSKVKTQKYSQKDAADFKNICRIIKTDAKASCADITISISILQKLYSKDILNYVLKNISLLSQENISCKAKELAKLALLASLEEISNYRKAGNGLKIRRGKTIKEPSLSDARDVHWGFLDRIKEDLDNLLDRKCSEPSLYRKSSLFLEEIKNESLDGVMFSPPYANCFDYTEIYKVELWFGQFVTSQSEVQSLKKGTVRSHLSAVDSKKGEASRSLELIKILELIDPNDLWSKKIPDMLVGYFEDMFTLLDSLHAKMKKGSFCVIVVSNSAYGGVVIPTDLLLSDYASRVGFNVKKIDVARNIITSSQQYKKTSMLKQYLRESIITLIKES